MIRPVKISDAKQICDIYNYYVKNTTISFEEDMVDPNSMEERIQTIAKTLPYIVYEIKGSIVGFAYASSWKGRSSYRYTVETSVYIKADHLKQGLGKHLYKHLIELLKNANIHVALAGITLPNEPSIALHEKLGFKKVGHLKEVGFKFEKWRDIEYYQLIL